MLCGGGSEGWGGLGKRANTVVDAPPERRLAMAEEAPDRVSEGSDVSEDDEDAHAAHHHAVERGEDLPAHERGGVAHNVPADRRRKRKKRPIVTPGDVVPLDPQMEVCEAAAGGGIAGAKGHVPHTPSMRRSWRLWGLKVPKSPRFRAWRACPA